MIGVMVAFLTPGTGPIAHIESKAGKARLLIEGQSVALPFRLDDYSIDIGNGLALSTTLHPDGRVKGDKSSVLRLTKNGIVLARLDLCAEYKRWVKHNWGGHRFTPKIRNSAEFVRELPVVYQALPLANRKVLAVVGYRQYDLDLGPKRADLVLLTLKPFKITYLRSLGFTSYEFSDLGELKPRLHHYGSSTLVLIDSELFDLNSDGRVGSLVMKTADDIYGIVNDHWFLSQTVSKDLKYSLLQATDLQNKIERTLFAVSRDIEIKLVPIQWGQRAPKSPYCCFTLDYDIINMREGYRKVRHPEFFAVNPATQKRIRLPEAVLCAGNYGIGATALAGDAKKGVPIYDLRSGRRVQIVAWR